MSDVQSVTLEILRHGPPHNQLLSPLTEYLGLCGNHGAVSLHVPYEHQEFLARLASLRYQEPAAQDLASRNEVLTKTAKEMAEIFAGVPGLISGLCDGATGNGRLTHLRLVLSAAELAMLPFELAKVPPGCAGGEGNWLSLQTLAPVSVTRQVRTVSNASVRWPRRPRVLFVAAAPAGLQIPFEQHLQAILRAALPWVKPFDRGNGRALEQASSEILTVVPRATIEDVERLCSTGEYSHVHVLAHGIENSGERGRPFGLALHSRQGPDEIDIVSGARFATALRPLREAGQDGRSARRATLPTVVTVASCDSGNIGSVVHNGASFAHELHQNGVPFVVASQFPLSFQGSIHMAEVLYEDLLWGEDPRIALHRLRKKLYALNASTHDWASLVAYGALPDDLDDQLEDVRYESAKRGIDRGMERLDEAIRLMADWKGAPGDGRMQVDPLIKQVDVATARMPRTGGYETEGNGMVASTEKRKAEALYHASQHASDEEKAKRQSESLKLLRNAMRYYKEAFHRNMMESRKIVRMRRSVHWVLCQYLSLRAILGEPFAREHWGAALISSHVDLDLPDPETRAWAHGTLAELYLLLLAYQPEHVPEPSQAAEKNVLAHAEHVVSIAGRDSFAVLSTRRQFNRYVTWWGAEDFVARLKDAGIVRERAWGQAGGLTEIAKRVSGLLS